MINLNYEAYSLSFCLAVLLIDISTVPAGSPSSNIFCQHFLGFSWAVFMKYTVIRVASIRL